MSYADYEYYTDNEGGYGGRTIPEEDWRMFTKQADALIDQLTSGRCKKLDPVPDCVKDAECSAADILYDGHLRESTSDEQSGFGSIRSESNDGYSISFGATDNSKIADARESIKEAAINEIRSYLSNTCLLLRWRSRKYDN